MPIINGNAYWAALQQPNTTFDPKWQIDVCNLTAEMKSIVEDTGLRVKNKGDDRGDFVSLSRRTLRKDGTPNMQPDVKDRGKNPFTELVGNGSEVNVKFRTWEYDNSFGKGTSGDLMAVQVVNHIPYASKEGDFEDFEALDAPAADDFDDLPLTQAG